MEPHESRIAKAAWMGLREFHDNQVKVTCANGHLMLATKVEPISGHPSVTRLVEHYCGFCGTLKDIALVPDDE